MSYLNSNSINSSKAANGPTFSTISIFYKTTESPILTLVFLLPGSVKYNSQNLTINTYMPSSKPEKGKLYPQSESACLSVK